MSTHPLLDILLKSTGASIDSRTILEGQIFFALPGSHTDGARFASAALENGASLAVVPLEMADPHRSGNYWIAEDVLATMQSLARDYRRYLDIPVMAITGSNGKTTNKNLLAAALSTCYRLHSTAGNFNNHIGLPLSILNTPKDANFLLLEMGTNHFGEIEHLCSIAEPDYGIILNVGKSHLEFLHSVEGVLKAKSELADFLYKNGGHLFINMDEESLIPLQTHPVKLIPFDRWHLPGSDFQVEVERSVPDILLVVKSTTGHPTFSLSSPLWGSHNVKNLIHALAVGSYFGLEMSSMIDSLSQFIPGHNRSQIVTWKGHQVYLDAYNANPTSMAGAIRSFREAQPDSGILILGDMGELGDSALIEHRNILELVKELDFEQVILIGNLFREAGERLFRDFRYHQDVTCITEQEFNAGAPMLIKGSRSMALERLVK